MHEQERSDPDEPDEHGSNKRNRAIGRHGADPGSPAVAQHANRQALAQNEQINRADDKHHYWMPVKAVAKAAPERQRQIFAHSQRGDIAQTAAVEVARAGVMDSVRLAPEIIGGQGQQPR